jgi:signal transduction histidine kinase/CheY-like chemotaxis protein
MTADAQPATSPPQTGDAPVQLYRWLIVAAVLVPALAFVLAAWQKREDVLGEGQETTIRTAAVLHEQALKVFDTIELVLARVTDRVRERTWDEIAAPETSDFLRDLKAPLDQVVSIWVTDANGIVRAGSQGWTPGTSIGDRDFFRAQRERDAGLFVSSAFSGRVTRTASFAISRRMPTPAGRFEGIVHVAVSPEYFERFFADVAPPVDHVAGLIRADGEILARQPERPEQSRLDPESPVRKAIQLAPDGGFFDRAGSIDGKRRFLAHRRVGGYPVYVVFGIDVATLLQRWYFHLWIYAAVAGAASAILLLVSGLALRRAKAEHAALFQLRQEVEQREAAEAALRQAQKMEAVGQLTGGVAHDFNNLLAVIAGNAELLLSVRPDEPRLSIRQVKAASAIARAADRGMTLTQQLLAFSRRRQALDVGAFDLNERLLGMDEMFTRSLRGDISIRTDLQPGLWPVKADPNQLELAVLNLAVNARDAMPDGGVLSIATRNVTLARPDLTGEFVALSVTDTGTGMTPEQRERAFEPFYTTKGIGKGTGLGLSTVYGFLQQSGGGAEIDSEPERGTTVTLYFPRAARSAATAAAAALGTAAETPGGGAVAEADAAADEALANREHDILLVEDDADVAEVAIAYLESFGYAVTWVKSGDAGKELISTGRSAPRLVLSDMYMPGLVSGIDLARYVRKHHADVPVILTTGAPNAAAEAQSNGFPVLPKPFNRKQLYEIIATANA